MRFSAPFNVLSPGFNIYLSISHHGSSRNSIIPFWHILGPSRAPSTPLVPPAAPRMICGTSAARLASGPRGVNIKIEMRGGLGWLGYGQVCQLLLSWGLEGWRVGGVFVSVHAVPAVCSDVACVDLVLNVRLVSIVSRSVHYNQK